jgi:hypothetical protein
MPIPPPVPLKAGLFGRGGAPKAPKATPTGAPPPRPPRGVRIEHRLGVQARPEDIWEVLYDLEHWKDWNPLYPSAAGTIRIGQTLDLTLALPGQQPQQIRPVVLEWVPNEQLHWRLSMMGGLVRTIRYIEIEKLADASCIISNGEIFGGFMGPSVAKRMGRAIHRGFGEMSEALKARAEARWQAEQG